MMIKRIYGVCALTLIVSAPMIYSVPTKSPRVEVGNAAEQEAWLTQEQARRLLLSVDSLIHQVKDLSEQNKAPRPSSIAPGDPGYPGCGLCDLTPVLAALCSIENTLICCCTETSSSLESIIDVLGACSDISTALPSQVDKSMIDALCLSVVSLLKTVLLELRGVFTTL
jgi:hypothetical protein